MSAAPPQDLPPKGGFPSIKIDRVLPRFEFPTRKKKRRQEVELRSARFAIEPILIAERDRALLKQMRINRDEERQLMKNKKGWTVGGYYGEPVFLSLPEDTYVEPLWEEYVAHTHPKINRAHHDLTHIYPV